MSTHDPRRISALIVDDEALARKRIKRLLANDSGIEVIGECSDGQKAVEAIRALVPDLLLDWTKRRQAAALQKWLSHFL
jgi:chemotaxis response regulator CheB